MFETFTLEGTQTSSGWSMATESYGDNTGMTFTTSTAGQIRYTCPNLGSVSNITLRYTATQITKTGTFSTLSASTNGSYVINTMQVLDTTEAVAGTSNGGLYVAGGATIAKSLNALNLNATSLVAGSATASNMTVTGTLTGANLAMASVTASNMNVTGTLTGANLAMASVTASNMNVTGTLTGANLAMASITAGNLRVPGTLTVTNITTQNLLQSSGTVISDAITTGSIFTTTFSSPGMTIRTGSFTSNLVDIATNWTTTFQTTGSIEIRVNWYPLVGTGTLQIQGNNGTIGIGEVGTRINHFSNSAGNTNWYWNNGTMVSNCEIGFHCLTTIKICTSQSSINRVNCSWESVYTYSGQGNVLAVGSGSFTSALTGVSLRFVDFAQTTARSATGRWTMINYN
jgi:hypothetical protein